MPKSGSEYYCSSICKGEKQQIRKADHKSQW